MSLIFYQDTKNKFTYDELFERLNNKKDFFEIYYAEDFLDFVCHVFLGIINSKKFILVDYLYQKGQNSEKIEVDVKVDSIDKFIEYIKTSKAEVGIWSSGSEGPPKLIFQPISRLLLSVRFSSEYQSTRWGLTYHPAHSAGIQLILQVVCNLSTIVYLRDLKGLKLKTFIHSVSLDYLAATPTFYRMLAPYDFELRSIKSVTINGERSTQKLISDLRLIFPNAKIRNIYGSTEAGPLMSSESEVFIIPSRLLDKVKVIENELFFHKSIVSTSVGIVEWYASGDIVEVLKEDPLTIKILSRKSRIINVGGHNVNPQQIEELILQMPEVVDVRVYGRKNNITDYLIVAEVLKVFGSDLSEKQIMTWVKQHFPLYKVPRIIKFVETIEVGRTGKKMVPNA
ncbi:MAG TPA: AMP-binding protein [Saprospiraceae bacterium]|nr:AMP-binding protein [Saprospiraceae bacterium]